ncbi:hypothetical protein OPT61_g8894 [Boeremia exigua]|uniref:Uncharacterized protein n=1 Tax=Boeremia exigua TaxID=749465 RepID=A0ACC2HWZ9_9PLEO|nr:hypothetical protein OPT61_g8894 [Boeremia exigua]
MASRSTATKFPVPLLQRSNRNDRHRNIQWQLWPRTARQPDDFDAESLECDHPDLEDGSLIAWGLRQSKDASGEGVQIDVLYGSGTDLHWSCNLSDDDLSQTLELPTPSLRVCFINTLGTDQNWLPGNFSPHPRTIQILRKAGLSGILLCTLYSEQSYWAKMGNQSFMKYDKNGKLLSHEICYQYCCGWDTGVSFTNAIRDKQRSTYFCINYPAGARSRIRTIFQHASRREVLHRDFFIDSMVADDCLKQWQFDIGQRRLMLLSIERTLEKPPVEDLKDESVTKVQLKSSRIFHEIVPSLIQGFRRYQRPDIEQTAKTEAVGSSPDAIEQQYWQQQLATSFGNSGKSQEIDYDKATRHLHKIVREWLGLRQACEDLLAQLKFLQNTSKTFKEKRGQDWTFNQTADAEETFEVLISQCGVCVRWAQSYHDRTQVRINMLFHLANQRTATDTARIAEQTQRDSASMITIAAVTMFFLPGTFICAILSTTFFEFGESGLQVSSQCDELTLEASGTAAMNEPFRAGLASSTLRQPLYQMSSNTVKQTLRVGVLFEETQMTDLVGLDILNNLTPKTLDIMSALLPSVESLREHTVPMEFLYISSSLDLAWTTPEMHVKPTHTYTNAPRDLDILLIGGPDPMSVKPASLGFLREASKQTKIIFTTCTGAMWLAKAGVLDGKKATTNRTLLGVSKQMMPNVEWLDQRWVVDEGHFDGAQIWTSGGAGCGIDMIIEYTHQNFNNQLVEMGCIGLDFDFEGRSQFYKTPLTGFA